MRLFSKFIPLVVLLLSFPNFGIGQASLEDLLFELQMKVRQAGAACSDAKCYRDVITKYGCSSTIERIKDAPDAAFEMAMEADRLHVSEFKENKDLIFIKNLKVTGSSAELVLGHRKTEGWTQTAYFCSENGIWKAGKP